MPSVVSASTGVLPLSDISLFRLMYSDDGEFFKTFHTEVTGNVPGEVVCNSWCPEQRRRNLLFSQKMDIPRPLQRVMGTTRRAVY